MVANGNRKSVDGRKLKVIYMQRLVISQLQDRKVCWHRFSIIIKCYEAGWYLVLLIQHLSLTDSRFLKMYMKMSSVNTLDSIHRPGWLLKRFLQHFKTKPRWWISSNILRVWRTFVKNVQKEYIYIYCDVLPKHCRVFLTRHGVQIANWIYWTLITRNYK
jgi:hypothetical protein